MILKLDYLSLILFARNNQASLISSFVSNPSDISFITSNHNNESWVKSVPVSLVSLLIPFLVILNDYNQNNSNDVPNECPVSSSC